MAEEEEKKKFNFKKIALFGVGPIALVGIGVGVGAFLFMPTQTPVEQVEELHYMVITICGGYLMIKETFTPTLVEIQLVWKLKHKLLRLPQTMRLTR